MSDGSAERLAALKRADAAARQSIARAELAGLQVHGDPTAYHVWLELPEPWRAEAFAVAALHHGIALTPASNFAVVPGYAPNAVRLALASPPRDVLAQAIKKISSIIHGQSEHFYE